MARTCSKPTVLKQHLDNLRRKDSLRGAETTEISVCLGNYSASHFEGSAESPDSHSAAACPGHGHGGCPGAQGSAVNTTGRQSAIGDSYTSPHPVGPP